MKKLSDVLRAESVLLGDGFKFVADVFGAVHNPIFNVRSWFFE